MVNWTKQTYLKEGKFVFNNKCKIFQIILDRFAMSFKERKQLLKVFNYCCVENKSQYY